MFSRELLLRRIVASGAAALALLTGACTRASSSPELGVTRRGVDIAIDPAVRRLYVTVTVGRKFRTTTALVVLDTTTRAPTALVVLDTTTDLGASGELTVDETRHLVYAQSTSFSDGPEAGLGGLAVVDGRTGRLGKRHALEAVSIQATGRRGVLANLSNYGSIAVLDGDSLERRGVIASDYGLPGGAVDEQRDRLYLISESGELAMFDLATYRRLWNVSLRSTPGEVAVDPGTGVVFVAGEGDPFLYAVDPRQGRVSWSLVLEDLGNHHLAAGRHGRIHVMDPAGSVATVDRGKRVIVGTVVVGDGSELLDMVADPTTGTIFVLDARGLVHVVDGDTMKVVGTIDAAAVPDPVLDPKTGRVRIPERAA